MQNAEKAAMMTKLTDRQARFVEEYLVDLNATQAAIRAGYSERTAQEQGSRLLSNVIVSQAVAKAQLARSRRTEVTQDRVVRELAMIAFANMMDYMRIGEDGDPYTDFSGIDRDMAAAIAEVAVEDFKDGRGKGARDVRRVKFKLADKRAALVDLGKHLGMFVERREVGSPGDFAQLSDAELERKEREISDQLQEFEGAKIAHSLGKTSQATH